MRNIRELLAACLCMGGFFVGAAALCMAALFARNMQERDDAQIVFMLSVLAFALGGLVMPKGGDK